MKPWRVQKFFGDVVYDLRNRGLLPVVILLVVGMVAVPMLISRGSSDSSNSLQPTAANVKPAPEGQQAVLAYNPGIREYKKRLNDLSAKDPFRQQFAHSAAAASALKSTVTTPPSTGSDTGSSSSAVTGTPTGTSGGSSTGTKNKNKKKKAPSGSVTYQVNVLAGDVNSELTPFNDVQALTPLPSQTAPVVIYFELSSDNGSALFLVSNRVGSVNGPGTCVPSPDDCALLALQPGQSEDLQYAQDGKTYRIVLAQIQRFTK
jgi:hypothetical protein